MLRSLFHLLIRRFEGRYGYDATYMHGIVDASPAAAAKLLAAQPMGLHRAGVAPAALHAARITAARFEDCGPCAQLAVDVALEAGVDPEVVKAVIARDTTRLAELSPDAAVGSALAEATLNHAPTDAARDEALRRYGEAGLVSLAFAIAGPRVYPTLKRALGHAAACERLHVGGEEITAAPA